MIKTPLPASASVLRLDLSHTFLSVGAAGLAEPSGRAQAGNVDLREAAEGEEFHHLPDPVFCEPEVREAGIVKLGPNPNSLVKSSPKSKRLQTVEFFETLAHFLKSGDLIWN